MTKLQLFSLRSLVMLPFKIHQKVLRQTPNRKRLNPGSRLLFMPLSILAWLFSAVRWSGLREALSQKQSFKDILSYGFVNMQQKEDDWWALSIRKRKRKRERQKARRWLVSVNEEKRYVGMYVHNILSYYLIINIAKLYWLADIFNLTIPLITSSTLTNLK